MMKHIPLFLMLAGFFPWNGGAAPAEEKSSKNKEEEHDAPLHTIKSDRAQEMKVTLYQNNGALFQEIRKVTLKAGENAILLKNVPQGINISTLMCHLHPQQSGSIQSIIWEAPLFSERTLKKTIGEKVLFRMQENETFKEGVFLGSASDLRKKDFLIQHQNHAFSVKRHLVALPTPPRLFSEILLHILAAENNESQINLEYLTEGFQWSCHYTAQVNEVDDSVAFQGTVTLKNNSLCDLKQTRLVLVSSQLAQPSEKEMSPLPTKGHSLTLPQKISLHQGEKKSYIFTQSSQARGERQFWLLSKTPYEKDTDGLIEPLKAQSMIAINNTEANGLGLPLLPGNLSVYQQSPEGFSRISDQSHVNYIHREGKIQLRLGNADGIQASLQQTDFKQLGARTMEVGYRLLITSTRTRPATVRFLQDIHIPDIEILRETIRSKRDNGLLWEITVPAHDRVELRYRLRVTLPEPKR